MYAFLMNICFALKGSELLLLFIITEAGVVPFGSRKKVFYFWSFEIKECILIIRK